MDWEALGAVGEVSGAVAVVLSLIYLAIQIRNQMSESRAATVHDISVAHRQRVAAISEGWEIEYGCPCRGNTRHTSRCCLFRKRGRSAQIS